MWDRGLLIIKVRSHISDVRIGQADNLPRVAGVGEDFLVSRETGVKNNFAAAPCICPRGASLKNSSVFKCKNPLPSNSFCQRTLFLAGSPSGLRVNKLSPHSLFAGSKLPTRQSQRYGDGAESPHPPAGSFF